MGWPMEIPLSGCSTRQQVDQMVVSVGPYMFHVSQPMVIRRCARSSGSASPPTNTRNVGLPCHPASIRIRQVLGVVRSEEHTSELQSLMRISYAVFCLKKKITHKQKHTRMINIHK